MIESCKVGGQRALKAEQARHALGYVLRGIVAAARRHKAAKRSPLVRRIEAVLQSMPTDSSSRVERVAAVIGCSRQTLYRRLKAEGTSFEKIRDDQLRRRAIDLLVNEKLSVKQVADRLGYSEAAAFSRAFKRWTGRSPSETVRAPGS